MNYQAVAILLLVGALIYLWATTVRLRQSVHALQLEVHQAAAPRPVAAATPAPAIDPQIIATIAAAVATVIRRPHRIIAVQGDFEARRAWSAEGRRELSLSHKIR